MQAVAQTTENTAPFPFASAARVRKPMNAMPKAPVMVRRRAPNSLADDLMPAFSSSALSWEAYIVSAKSM